MNIGYHKMLSLSLKMQSIQIVIAIMRMTMAAMSFVIIDQQIQNIHLIYMTRGQHHLKMK